MVIIVSEEICFSEYRIDAGEPIGRDLRILYKDNEISNRVLSLTLKFLDDERFEYDEADREFLLAAKKYKVK